MALGPLAPRATRESLQQRHKGGRELELNVRLMCDLLVQPVSRELVSAEFPYCTGNEQGILRALTRQRSISLLFGVEK